MGFEIRCRLIARGAMLLLGLGVLAAAVSGAGMMAQTELKVVDGGVPTLHVYTNLIQIPTLVVAPNRVPIGRPIDARRFSVSIDSGPWFRATHVRQEGEDPISLSILLDLSGDTAQLVPKIRVALASLAPLSLHARDRVSIYALRCGLITSVRDVPADSEILKKMVDAAVEPWMQRKSDKHAKSCERTVPLWDGLADVAFKMVNSQGRRVVLTVTDGQDKGSKHSSDDVMEFAQDNGIAVFGLSYGAETVIGDVMITGRRGGGGVYRQSGTMPLPMDAGFISLCEGSGGIVTKMDDRKSLRETLQEFVQMVRQRYIVEFPRPSNSTPGAHNMEVKIEKGYYLIYAAGVSVPVPDAALMSDPTTIQLGPAQAPVEGTKRLSTKPQ